PCTPHVPSLAEDHASRIAVVFLAEIVERLIAGRPSQEPATGPGCRITTRIINCRLVAQLVVIRTREFFDEMQLARVRYTLTREPEAFVEAHRVDHEGVAFPLADAVAVPRRLEILRVRATVQVHVAPAVRRADAEED